ncbi:TPM domain-containing protein [Streptococcus cameli]
MKKILTLFTSLLLCLTLSPSLFADSIGNIRNISLPPGVEKTVEDRISTLNSLYSFSVYFIGVDEKVPLQETANQLYQDYIGQDKGIIFVSNPDGSEVAIGYRTQDSSYSFNQSALDEFLSTYQSAQTLEEKINQTLSKIEEQVPITQKTPTVLNSNGSLLVDQADLLSDTEEKQLLEQLTEVSKRHKTDVAVVTIRSLNGQDVMNYADAVYDQNGYGQGATKDGILLLISMEHRDWHITTAGSAIDNFTDAGLEYMENHFLSDISDGHYANGFAAFADLADQFLTQAATGKPYDVGNMPRNPLIWLILAPISVVLALFAAFGVTSGMKNQLISVHGKNHADEYVASDAMTMTHSQNIFRYRRFYRQAIPRTASNYKGGRRGGSSRHISSLGISHGGHGGKF